MTKQTKGNDYVKAVAEFRGLGTTAYGEDILQILLERFEIEESHEFAVAWGEALGKDTTDPDALIEEMYAIWEEPNVPLTGHRRELVKQQVNDGIDGNNGNAWLTDHAAAMSHYFLNGKLSDEVKKLLGEYHKYVYEASVDGVQISEWQYINCAEELFAERCKSMQDEDFKEVIRNAAFNLNTGAREHDFTKDIGKYLERHPEQKSEAWDAVWSLAESGDWDAEQFLYPEFMAVFGDEIKKTLQRFNDLWLQEEPDGVDYSCFDEDIQLMFNEAGFGKPDQLTTEAMDALRGAQFAEQKLKASFTPTKVGMKRDEYLSAFRAALNGEQDVTGAVNVIDSLDLPTNSDKKLKRYIVERIKSETSPVGQKLIAAATGEEVETLIRGIYGNGKWNNVNLDEEEEEPVNPQEATDELIDTFNDAMNGCNFDEVFSRANEFKQLIRENIQEIADNFNSENPFAPSGYEEPWLVGLLMKSGALFEGDINEGDEDDEEEEPQHGPVWEVDDRYSLLLLITKEEWEQKIQGDPAHEGKWVPVRNNANDAELMRFTEGEALIQRGTGNRMNAGEYGKRYRLVDIEAVELCLTAKYVPGFDYCPLLEAAISDGSLAAETDLDAFCSMLEAPQTYWPGDKGGYQEERSVSATTSFKGKRVCITGKFDLTRTQLEGLITDVGGIVASGVSKTLDFLIAGEDSGSKLAKAKDLGITILDRDDLTDILGDDLEVVSPVAAKRVIAELLKSLADIGGDGYFRIDDIEETHITRTSSLEHLEAWLSERIGFDKYRAGYQTWDELKELKITFTPIDPVNNITVWLFDNECGLATEPEIRTFNTIEDARIFAREADEDWGGHCSVIKVITKKGTEETVQLGYEADFPSWGGGVDEYGNYLVCYKDDVVLIAAVGGEEVWKKMVNDSDFEPIKTAIREGRWPVVKDREFNSKYD